MISVEIACHVNMHKSSVAWITISCLFNVCIFNGAVYTSVIINFDTGLIWLGNL